MNRSKKYAISIGIIVCLLVGYLFADNMLFNGIKPRTINQDGFQATYFVKDVASLKTTIVLIGGGQWGDYWARQFAAKNMVSMSLPYIGKQGLPKLPEEIKLEYFENAIKWLRKQPEVAPNKIVIMGASRNAELALLIASTFPTMVSGVVAYAPSSVSWSNTVLPYNSNDLKPSWKYKGIAIPYIPMDKISGNDSDTIQLVAYWKNGLAKTDFVKQAAIKVEKINGPILLFSGNDDKVWPSSQMADMIEQRLKENKFQHYFRNIKYENAGHLISSNPEETSNFRVGTMTINGKNYQYEFGGTIKGDIKAKQDAKRRLMEFIEKL